MERAPAVQEHTAKTLRVLVLEDSARDAELIVRELRSFGYKPQWTRVETEEDFRSHLDSGLDLVLADYSLPQFDALSALTIMQDQGLLTPFIIVTGTITEETAVSILKQGADDFLLKDRLTRLGPAVASALQQRRLRDERVRAQQLLIEREERYRRLVTRMSAMVVELDPKGAVVFVNEAVRTVTGFSPDEVLGRKWFDLLFSGEHQEQIDVAGRILSRGEDLRNYVTHCRARDGSWLSLEWNTANEYGADGRPQKILAFGLDITGRERAEATLRKSEARLRQAQEIGRIGDWELDLETHQLIWSAQMFRLYERDPAPGAPTIDEILQLYISESGGPPTGDNLRRAVATGERVELESRLTLPSGREAWHTVMIIPRKNGDGRVTKVFGTVQDITERKKLQQQTEADARHLAQLSRRVVAVQEEERRRLAGELHDRTSPNLAAASLNLGMIAADLPPQVPGEVQARLEDTRALLADTTAGIRDVCADLRPSTLDYAGLTHALREYAAQVARRTGIAIEVSDDSPAERLHADTESMLFRIAQEALTNCAKHAQASAVDIELSFGNPEAVLTISDNGTGFDPDALGQSGHRPGLGLLTMRERVEFAGGKFRLESAPGKGTRIRVEISGGHCRNRQLP